MRHSPAPWKRTVGQDGCDYCKILDACGKLVANVNVSDGIDDSILIAKAPELLDALDEVLSWVLAAQAPDCDTVVQKCCRYVLLVKAFKDKIN